MKNQPHIADQPLQGVGTAITDTRAGAKAKRRPITKWSVLALIVMVIGTVVTLGLDQAFLMAWAGSGKSFPISRKANIQLPPGETHVWYESPFSVPVADVTLLVVDENGDRVRPESVGADISYNLLLGDQCGRALWKLRLPRAGMYEVRCDNHNFLSDSQIPPEDRVVFLKTPDTLSQANAVRKVIQVTGATMSVTLVIVFYILHGLALKKRRTAAAAHQLAM